jgi:hypothetical protein
MPLDAERVVELVNSHGFVIIHADDFFGLAFDEQSWRRRLDELLRTQLPAGDQPGALRYHLSGKSIEDLLNPWLSIPGLSKAAQAILGCDSLQVNYIRYREPLYGQGLQKLHRDWNVEHPQKRLEMFVAFDEITRENGCTEVIDRATGLSVSVLLSPGSAVLIDSSVLHRGTRNRSGMRRRVVSLQIGPFGGINSSFVCKLHSESTPARLRVGFDSI